MNGTQTVYLRKVNEFMLLFVRYDMLICKEWILYICPYLQRKPEIDRNCMFDYTRINKCIFSSRIFNEYS